MGGTEGQARERQAGSDQDGSPGPEIWAVCGWKRPGSLFGIYTSLLPLPPCSSLTLGVNFLEHPDLF